MAQNKETLKAGIYKELTIPQHQTPSVDAVPITRAQHPPGTISLSVPIIFITHFHALGTF